MKIPQRCKKSYTNVSERDLEFEVHDWVKLKVSPMKGVMIFCRRGSLFLK